MFCAIDIIMHNVFNSSCENKINLIISYKHNFSYMLDIQSFSEESNRAAASCLPADSILHLLYYRKFSLVLITILKKKNIQNYVVSDEGKRGVTFQNEWNKGNAHKDLKLWRFETMGTKKCKIQKTNIIRVFFKLFYYMASIEYMLWLAVFLWWLGITS